MIEELDDLTLARARTGDAAAFRRLVVMYQGPVHALIWRFMSRKASFAEVEELAQETLFRVYRALPEFQSEGPGRLTKWILTIAGRIAIDALRRKTVPVAAAADADEVAGTARADELTERRAIASAIERAARALPDDQRMVFLLRDYHDFTYEEMAAALDVDLGTIKSRLSRARASLREALKELRHGEG